MKHENLRTCVNEKRPGLILPSASLGYSCVHSHSHLPQTVGPQNITHSKEHGDHVHNAFVQREKKHIKKIYEIHVTFWTYLLISGALAGSTKS